jgi:hypothetical protein
MLISLRVLYEKMFNYDAQHFISRFSFLYYLLFSFPISMRCDFFAFVVFSKRIKGEFCMLMIMEVFLYLYRLLHPYFILNEVFFSRLYHIPYLMPVNSVADLPCRLVCVFNFNIFFILSSLFFVKEKRHAVLPISCGLHVVMGMWNLHFGRRKCNLNIL